MVLKFLEIIFLFVTYTFNFAHLSLPIIFISLSSVAKTMTVGKLFILLVVNQEVGIYLIK